MASAPLNKQQQDLLKLFVDCMNDHKLMETRKKISSYFFKKTNGQEAKLIEGRKYSDEMISHFQRNN